jgi:cyclic pyranopterin phosphate synthase
VDFTPPEDLLTLEEIERVVKAAARAGVEKVRLTGGEPLMREGLSELARKIKAVSGIKILGVTTNGVLLHRCARELFDAGVDGLNISLDTLDPRRYKALTGGGDVGRVMRGLEAARALPFKSIKINCVLSPDIRESDWMGVIGLARDFPVDVKLIEFMPVKTDSRPSISAKEVLRVIESTYGGATLLSHKGGGVPPVAASDVLEGPAVYYKPGGFKGRVGIIAALSGCFCASCDRLRLSAAGGLRSCLFGREVLELRALLRNSVSDSGLDAAVAAAVRMKPKGYDAGSGPGRISGESEGLFRIGG